MLRTTRTLFRLATRSMATETQREAGLYLTFASPSQSFYKDTKVKQVDVPSYSGNLGLLANHVPILAVMKPGVVTVYEEDGNSKKIFVAAGTVTMNEDSSLLLLASEAVSVEDLDVDAAQKTLASLGSDSSAEAKIQTEVNQAIIDANR